MNKHYLKIIIMVLNELSLQYNDREELQEATVEMAYLKDNHIVKNILIQAMDLLTELEAYEWIDNVLDFFPPAVIYSHSPSNSQLEALAAFELVCHSHTNRKIIKAGYLPGGAAREIMRNSILLKDNMINPSLEPYCRQILEEMDKDEIISDTLAVMYTRELYKVQHIVEYRNEDKEPIKFRNMDFILKNLPHKGIPANRDTAKNLQSYYKDTQMHEFDHQCPICGANVPAMLIASHIKPFRDCAHIFECADHNNGLLLCRNHDYLFDQGYFSLNEDGTLLYSEPLKRIEDFNSRFNLKDDYVLPEIYQTENRMKYLEYHRANILKK